MIKSLQKTIKDIEKLRKGHSFSTEHTRWISNCLYLLEDVFGQNSRIYITFANLPWKFRGTMATDAHHYEYELHKKNHEYYLRDLDTAKGMLESAIDQIKQKGIENVYEGKDPASQSSDIVRIISLIDTKLRKFIRNEPEKEKEIQDALENLFIGADLDKEFTREKETIPYSSKFYIPDFVFKKISTLVEIKLCTSTAKEKEIISEINDDILAYKTEYSNIIFVVYDLGHIRDQDQFRNSLEEHDEHIIVKVVKH